MQKWSKCALLKPSLSHAIQLPPFCTSKIHNPIPVIAPGPAASVIGATATIISAEKASLIGRIEQPPIMPDGEIQPTEAMAMGTSPHDFPDAPPPELCCGSGCPNCVYIQFADEVLQYVKSLPLHDGIVEKQKKMVREALQRNVQDENLRAYLLMEIDAKGY